MDLMPSDLPEARWSPLTAAAKPPMTEARGWRDIVPMAGVALLAIPYAAVLGGVFLLGRWDALKQRLSRT